MLDASLFTMMQDLWDHLKLSPPRYDSYEAACAAVAEIEAAEAAAAASGLAAIEEDEESDGEGPDDAGDGGSEGGSDGEEDGESQGGGEAEEEEVARWGWRGKEMGGRGHACRATRAAAWLRRAARTVQQLPCSAVHPPPHLAATPCLPCPRMESEEEEEEDVRMVRPASATPVEVDEDFEREFGQLMLDYQGRPAGGAGPAGAPGALRQQPGAGAAAAAAAGSQHTGDGGAAAGAESEAGGGSVAFKVMMKRAGREDRTRELHIPLTAGMAAHLRQKEEREAAEKAELKRCGWVAVCGAVWVKRSAGRAWDAQQNG